MSDERMTPNERRMLRDAAMTGGIPPSIADRFCDEVERRLRIGAKEYGEHQYLSLSYPECQTEAVEEQHDAPGWTSLALRLLERDVGNGFPKDEAELVRLHALKGIALAQQSAVEFESAIQHYRLFEDEITGPPTQPEPPFSCNDERLVP